jgi:hypothetical protein
MLLPTFKTPVEMPGFFYFDPMGFHHLLISLDFFGNYLCNRVRLLLPARAPVSQ